MGMGFVPFWRQRLVAVALLALSACALPPQKGSPSDTVWNGRLAMTIHSNPTESVQAGFELSGNAQHGQLLLLTPIGTTAASAQWSPERVVVQRGQSQQTFANTESMMVALTGAPVPLDALFDWLRGSANAVAGWSVDLGPPPLHRLIARRTTPEPVLTLRVVLNPSP